MNNTTASRILAKLRSDNGFTFDVRTGLFIASGFSVSPYKKLEKVLPAPISQDQIIDYAHCNNETLAKKDHFFGGWVNDDMTFLDISIVVTSLRFALRLARLNDQLAIFDLATFTEHKVDQSEKIAHGT